MVLVDLSRELDEGVRNEILKMATINLYIAGQKLRSLDLTDNSFFSLKYFCKLLLLYFE